MPAAAARSRNISAPGASDRALSNSKPTSTDWIPARGSPFSAWSASGTVDGLAGLICLIGCFAAGMVCGQRDRVAVSRRPVGLFEAGQHRDRGFGLESDFYG